jgi:hypothetical protein
MSARRFTVIALLLAVFLFLPILVLAQTGAGFDLAWNTVDAGGYTFSTEGGYALGGTIGQADAGMLSGGSYTLSGGFWAGGEITAHGSRIYLPLVLRAAP